MEQEEYSRSIKDYLSILWRRRVYVLIPFVLILAISVPIIMSLEAYFVSSGTVLIESQQIPEELIQSTITGFADERLQVIIQRVMTSSQLFSIVEKFNLYKSVINTSPRGEIISDMRKKIKIERINAEVKNKQGKKTDALIAFKVSFEHKSPNVAQRVTNELITLFLQENVRKRTQQAKEASQFLEKEAERLAVEIEKSETALAQYKSEYKNSLPENFKNLTRRSLTLDGELNELSFNIETKKNEIKLLEMQEQQARAASQANAKSQSASSPEQLKLLEMQQRYISLTSRYGTNHPDVKALKREMETYRAQTGVELNRELLQTQLSALESEKTALLKKYAASHPDIQQKDKEIAQLQQRLDELPESKDENALDVTTQNILNAISAAKNETALLQQNERTLRESKIEIEANLEQIPQVERALEALNRDYRNLLAKYQDIRSKQLQAELARTLEEDQKAERFTLLEPPSLPSSPSKPNRKKLIGFSLVLSLGAGLGLAFLMEIANGAIRGPNNLAYIAQMDPIAQIPYIETTIDRKKRRRNTQWVIIALVIMAGVSLVLAHFFYKRLDLIFYRVLELINIS